MGVKLVVDPGDTSHDREGVREGSVVSPHHPPTHHPVRHHLLHHCFVSAPPTSFQQAITTTINNMASQTVSGGDKSVMKVSSKTAPKGEMGQKYLAAGIHMGMKSSSSPSLSSFLWNHHTTLSQVIYIISFSFSFSFSYSYSYSYSFSCFFFFLFLLSCFSYTIHRNETVGE